MMGKSVKLIPLVMPTKMQRGKRSSKERRRTLLQQHLLRAVQGSLVHLLRCLALHARFDAILRLSEEDGDDARTEPCGTIEQGILLPLLHTHDEDLHDEDLGRHPHRLVRALLQDGRQSTSVESQWALALQDLHDGITRPLVLARVLALVIRDACFHRLPQVSPRTRPHRCPAPRPQPMFAHGLNLFVFSSRNVALRLVYAPHRNICWKPAPMMRTLAPL